MSATIVLGRELAISAQKAEREWIVSSVAPSLLHFTAGKHTIPAVVLANGNHTVSHTVHCGGLTFDKESSSLQKVIDSVARCSMAKLDIFMARS
jgi:hypothetical protein